MNRIEEFTQDGKSFVYFDLSNFKSNDEFAGLIEASKPVMQKYEGKPLYTVTNIKDLRFDTTTKRIVAEWMRHNAQYVKYGAVIGVDSIKQLMLNSVFALSGRKNMRTAASKEEAVKWLLGQAAR